MWSEAALHVRGGAGMRLRRTIDACEADLDLAIDKQRHVANHSRKPSDIEAKTANHISQPSNIQVNRNKWQSVAHVGEEHQIG